MIKKIGCFLFSTLFFFNAAPFDAHAQGVAPEMFGVGEIVINYAQFDDPKASDSCGLSRETIASILAGSLVKTGLPAVSVADARPPIMGVARIQLIPEISSHVDENMDCISWISLSAESRANVVILPVTAPRSIVAVYWRQHTKVYSGQSIHAQKIGDVLKKMADQFAQQYRLDQPTVLTK
jgi:hypothetical protein